jgi:carbon starvation protein
MGETHWVPGAVFTTVVVTTGWGLLVYTGQIGTIWPMFGIANQLLAAVALAVGTTVIINGGKARYAWVTMIPLLFVSITTLTAGVMSVRDNFWPMAIGPDTALNFQGYLNTGLTVIMMLLVVVILANAVWRWIQVLRGRVQAVPLAVE